VIDGENPRTIERLRREADHLCGVVEAAERICEGEERFCRAQMEEAATRLRNLRGPAGLGWNHPRVCEAVGELAERAIKWAEARDAERK
jgi:hypothetical protein